MMLPWLLGQAFCKSTQQPVPHDAQWSCHAQVPISLYSGRNSGAGSSRNSVIQIRSRETGFEPCQTIAELTVLVVVRCHKKGGPFSAFGVPASTTPSHSFLSSVHHPSKPAQGPTVLARVCPHSSPESDGRRGRR